MRNNTYSINLQNLFYNKEKLRIKRKIWDKIINEMRQIENILL